MSIKTDKIIIDLTADQEENIVVTNTGSTVENVSTNIEMAGIEVSPDDGSNWYNDVSFSLTNGDAGYQIGGTGNDGYFCPIIVGDYIYAAFTTNSNPFDGEVTGSNICCGITKRNLSDYSKVWTEIIYDATYSIDEVVFKVNPNDGKLWLLYHKDSDSQHIARFDTDGNQEATIDLGEIMNTYSHVYDLEFDETTSVFCCGRSFYSGATQGYVKKIDYALTTIAWTYRAAATYLYALNFNTTLNHIYVAGQVTGNLSLTKLTQAGAVANTKNYALGTDVNTHSIYVDDSENIYTITNNYSNSKNHFRKDTMSANVFNREITDSNYICDGYIDVVNEVAYMAGYGYISSVSFTNTLNWSVARPSGTESTSFFASSRRLYVLGSLLYFGGRTTGDFAATNAGGEDAILFVLNTSDGSLNYIDAESKTLKFRHDQNVVTTSNTNTTFSIDGSNSITITPSIDTPDLDLRSSATKDLTVVNKGIEMEDIDLNNEVPGLEWSDDDGSNWYFGGTNFKLGLKLLPSTTYFINAAGELTTDSGIIIAGTTDSSGNITVAIENLAEIEIELDAIGTINNGEEQELELNATGTVNNGEEQELELDAIGSIENP